MLALPYIARNARYQLRMHAISCSKHMKFKFILRVFWSIIRKLAPMKISRYTVFSLRGTLMQGSIYDPYVPSGYFFDQSDLLF